MSGLLRVVLAAALALAAFPSPGRPDPNAWPELPVLHNGRVMPMDSYARTLLLSFSGRSTFDRKPAAQWLARTLFEPEQARADAIFLINHPEVEEALGLPADGRRRFSAAELQNALPELTRLARAAFHQAEEERTPVDLELIRLFNNLDVYRRLTQAMAAVLPRADLQISHAQLRTELGLSGTLTLRDLLARQDRVQALWQAAQQTPARPDASYLAELRALAMTLRTSDRPGPALPPALFPVTSPTDTSWITVAEAARRAEFQPELDLVARIAQALRASDGDAFDQAADELAKRVRPRLTTAPALRGEHILNRMDPFYRSELLYGLGFLLALASIALRGRGLYRVTLAITLLAILPHTYGIIARMVVMQRPPVTNLYATFVFVAWTCALLGLALEYFQRNRLGLLTAAACGLSLLLTARRFGEDGDTMGVMVAVLDSNFWLATHVVTISMGYAGCVISGLLAHIYLLQALRRAPSDPVLAETFRAVFGTQAFGLLFSFVGTMLGGVWADQSWGRFWGWDPKENGALVIVLWSAILFHARLGRMIGPRGFAAGAVLGVTAVLLAWLGVNLLGVGLHSYGFTSGIARGLLIACLAEVLFVVATLPWSRRKTPAVRPSL